MQRAVTFMTSHIDFMMNQQHFYIKIVKNLWDENVKRIQLRIKVKLPVLITSLLKHVTLLTYHTHRRPCRAVCPPYKHFILCSINVLQPVNMLLRITYSKLKNVRHLDPRRQRLFLGFIPELGRVNPPNRITGMNTSSVSIMYMLAHYSITNVCYIESQTNW